MGGGEEKFYTPVVAKILYWLANIGATIWFGIVVYGLCEVYNRWFYFEGGGARQELFAGLGIALFSYVIALMIIRISYELCILFFKMYNRLKSIDSSLKKIADSK